ncbi:Os04g0611050, partial [Oryza sativa Japonica Group]
PYMSRLININMNVGNTKMTYIVKRREYKQLSNQKKKL